ncbi:MAG TPA: DNA alkylation repair protein [Candidatus Dormibacteraeota bacterium]|nr:DNA alkylation repair protein [Candidatus Dormibacteraeota bacterium]
MTRPALLARLRAELAAAADPAIAPQMQAYMKSSMPYHGVRRPELKAICKRVYADIAFDDCATWARELRAIWRGARYREERYAALLLAADRRFASCLTPDAMPVLEEFVVSGAWWDYVDETSHLVGNVLRMHPRRMKPLMRRWSRDSNLWKRRVAIICQISFKKETDLELLYANIEPNLEDREFFIRRAIGWALRAYAWTDPAEIVRYVREKGPRLSNISRREALINVPAELLT